jgi:superfamily II DNA or RNA helicase
MRAVVDSVIRLPGLQPKAHELLWRGLTFPNPEYLSRVRFNRWVGATPEEITLLEQGPDGEVIVPRGAVALVRQACAAAREPVSFEDRRVTLPREPLDLKLALRDYQEEAMTALVRNVQGVAVVPCGGGKTVIGTAAIARIGQPALVIVHTHDLAEQWRGAFRDILGVEAGDLDGSSPMVVATVQSLAAMPRERLAEVGLRFGTVIVDEVHHAPAITFREVLGAMPGKFRLGLTATPTRADGLTPLVELGIGPIVFRIAHDELVAAGHLVIPQVVVVPTGCTAHAETFAGMIDELRLNVGRDRLITDLAAREARAGRSVLVLSARVKHCELLAQRLRVNDQVQAEALTARVAKGKRTEILDRFRAGTLKVVCATSLADEGLDVARLERLILAMPARAEGRTVQRLGRLMRPHPDKATPVLYDLVDDVPMARRQHAARLRAYRTVLGREALARSTGEHPPRDCAREGAHAGPRITTTSA